MGILEFAWRVSRAPDVAELAACILDDGGDLAHASARGLYVFSEARIDIHVRNVPRGTIEWYERVARRHDPVTLGISSSHAPCQCSFADLWRHACENGLPDDYLEFLEYGMSVAPDGHYLAAPLVVDGVIAGTINLARMSPTTFSPAELMTASAMALHVSTRLAVLRALKAGIDPAWADVLTARGLEVADLAARGLTMHEIGRLLGISSNTAKKHLRVVYERLGIATRAELGSMLANAALTPARAGRDPRRVARRA